MSGLTEIMNGRRSQFALAALLAVVFGGVGCSPVYSTHPLADPDHVTELIVWSNNGGSGVQQFAVVRGDAARPIVRCMKYERQDNPFYNGTAVCSCIPSALGVIVQDDGTAVRVAFFGDDRIEVSHGIGVTVGPYKDLFARLPWQAGSPPTTRPLTTNE